MNSVDEIPKSYDNAVGLLAKWHSEAQAEYDDLQIYSIPNPGDSVVRLVEISDFFPATGDVFPVTLGASPEFPFKSSVVIATQDEWEKLKKGIFMLPAEWDLKKLRKVWPSGKK